MSAELAALVRDLRYKRGWSFRLDYGLTSGTWGCNQAESIGGPVTRSTGLTVSFLDDLVTLIICVETEDNLKPGKMIHVEHRFTVPYPTLVIPWHRWLLHCIQQVETHEMCEAFAIGDQRPFFPEHGPGANLYAIRDRGLEWPPRDAGQPAPASSA
jgi:hypothetical protein